MSALQEVKWYLVEHLNLAKDALHIYVALVLVLGSCLALGWRVREWRPWLLVLFVVVAGEAWDVRDSLASNDPIDLWENWKDIWNTMLAPSALLIAARHSRMFLERPPPSDDDSGDEAEVAAPALGSE